jgi:carbon-monoxide dehydrogenase medium subunit
MIPASFDYITPYNLADALRALSANGDEAKILAGGQSLLPLLKLRLANPKLLVDLRKIPRLASIRQTGDKIVIGAMATHFHIESSVLLRAKCPLLTAVASVIGDVQVRNRGTIGGSLSHADPAADWPAAILALGGEVKITGSTGERWLPAADLFVGPMTTAIEETEILTEVRVPAASTRAGSAYEKMAQQASGFAIVGVAASIKVDRAGRCDDVGVGITGLSEKPFRAGAVEAGLRGNKLTAKLIDEASSHAADGVEPLEDIHADADYRGHLARVLTRRALQAALKHATPSHR